MSFIPNIQDTHQDDKELWTVIEKQRLIIQQLQGALNDMALERDGLLEKLQNRTPTPPPRSPFRTNQPEKTVEKTNNFTSVLIKVKLFQQTSFTLSIVDKKTLVELWSIEKLHSEFLDLDTTLKALSTTNNTLLFYDKSFLFFNKSVDNRKRKLAIEEYFEQILQFTDDQALFLFLLEKPHLHQGHLTKRTKFGWTRYFFILTDTRLFCFDRHDGQLFVRYISLVPETQIGKQSSGSNVKESFRHAFVILNKDHNTILCAASDKERDKWVKMLLKSVKPKEDKKAAFVDKKPDSVDVNDHRKSFWSRKKQTSETTVNNDSSFSGSASSTLFPVFGVSLEEAVYTDKFDLPAIAYRCIEYLEARHAIYEEGIYRMSGSSLQISQLRQKFGEEGDMDLLQQDLDLHVVAGLLKCWLRELPDNVLTKQLLNEFVSVLGRLEYQDRPSRIKILGRLVSRLPTVNYSLLRALIAHLIHIVHHAERNKMSLRNLSIVFAPTLSIPSGVFALLMTEFDYVFYTTPEKIIIPPIHVPEPSTSADRIKQQYLKTVEQEGRSDHNSVRYKQRVPLSMIGIESMMNQGKLLISEMPANK
ncbi:hypothetical protein CU098_013210 [Rhizopus stolonifer]|uniref:RhoGAP-domain-containing protein n=1 Tax=Rhizopus stolonifer TaxID=4846 RepID=A0A367KTE1_RHIST|nr:hypothetical protein CU098_013210 [Rhizopus stolonifer]